MKSKLFKTMAASLLISMSLYTLPVAAFTKDETIDSKTIRIKIYQLLI